MSDKDDKNGEVLCCSFCGKSQNEVKKLVAGRGVYICDECIEVCINIVADEMNEIAKAEGGNTAEKLPTPSKIKEFLDQYVIGQDQAKKVLSVARVMARPKSAFSNRCCQRMAWVWARLSSVMSRKAPTAPEAPKP